MPFSPSTSTLASVGAARAISELTRAMPGAAPIKGGVLPGVGSATAATLARSVATVRFDRRKVAAVRTVVISRSFDQGLDTKSVAPRFIASTAMFTPACAVIITTINSGSAASSRSSRASPSAALVAPRAKLASSSATSGERAAAAVIASSGLDAVITSRNMVRSNSRAAVRMSSSSSMTRQQSNSFVISFAM